MLLCGALSSCEPPAPYLSPKCSDVRYPRSGKNWATARDRAPPRSSISQNPINFRWLVLREYLIPEEVSTCFEKLSTQFVHFRGVFPTHHTKNLATIHNNAFYTNLKWSQPKIHFLKFEIARFLVSDAQNHSVFFSVSVCACTLSCVNNAFRDTSAEMQARKNFEIGNVGSFFGDEFISKAQMPGVSESMFTRAPKSIRHYYRSVSYTHLTLPTNREV